MFNDRFEVDWVTGKPTATAKKPKKLRADAVALLDLFGVYGEERHRVLDGERPRAYTEPHDDAPKSTQAPLWMVQFNACAVPGLLQTPAYARAMHAAAGISGAHLDGMVEARMERQAVLTKRGAPRYIVIVDEVVLHRGFGGRDVMAQQLSWLAGCARQKHIDFHVIPFRRGGYANSGPFLMSGYLDKPPVVHLEHRRSDPPDIDFFQGLAVRLLGLALNSAESVRFLTKIAGEDEWG
ncbi:DUF5753 domain-containing protein [Actinokineospora sp. HUAS TT18]|uniref:DUF5753 domain-containing protein n=1 Tax=Actinokineospora sp. HUAS TT18 TaxID=3447451 RepID=UPI003F51C5DC